MLNVENIRAKFESRSTWQMNKRKDGEYSDRHTRANWSLFQEAFTAGYELAKEEQGSNLTFDQCCNELGMDDGSIRLCGECKGKRSKWISVNGSDIWPFTTEDLFLLVDGKVILGRYARDCFVDTIDFIVEPTHYMRIVMPEPPKE